MMRDRPSIWIATAGTIGLAGVAIGAAFHAREAAAAWLFAAFFALGLSAGAISLLLAGRLTGGDWIETLRPALRPMARAIPAIGIVFIPLLFALPLIEPWAAEGAHDPSVASFYLNWPLFTLRMAIAFAGWSVIAFLVLDIPDGRGAVAAGLGLVFHIVMTSFLAYDWILALQPAFTSSVFGAQTAILFLLSALCLAVLTAPVPQGKTLRDIAGLMIAGMAGSVYLGFMQFLIIWYGNLPDTVQFYLERESIGWLGILVIVLVIGALVPIALLLPSSGRASFTTVRAAALLVLVGVMLRWSWCVLALFHPAAIVMAPFALAAVLAAFATAFMMLRTGTAAPRSSHE